MPHPSKRSDDRFGLSEATLQKIASVIETFPKIDRVILFGSRAMNSHHPGSDIDLAIEGQTFTEQDRFQLALKLDDLDLPYQIDLCHLDRLTNPALLDHIHRVGKEFYLCRRNRDHSPRTDPSVHY